MSGAGKTILIVEDDPPSREVVRLATSAQNHTLIEAATGVEGLNLAREQNPDLIILDVNLPGMSGLDVCRRLRAEGARVPIIMLTAKSDTIDVVVGLELGADDYVTKPFSLHEFLARVKARLRRASEADAKSSEAIAAGDIVLDPARQSLVVRGHSVALAPKEFSLLQVLMENRGRVVTRQTLLDKVWGYDFEGDHQTISVHVRWLREKIEIDPNNPRHIITVRGRGYMFASGGRSSLETKT